VLEPSCGEAAFLLEAAAVLETFGAIEPEQLRGIELHEDSARLAEIRLGQQGITGALEVGDFFGTAPRPHDAVIGNPPYVRYQDFNGPDRAGALTAARAAGVELSRLASSWAAFTAHAAASVAKGGRLGLVLPAELLTVNYAQPLRAFLLARFTTVRLVLFQERIFPGVSEEVVLLLAEGDGPTSTIEVCEVPNAAALTTVEVLPWRRYIPDTDSRWSSALLAGEVSSTFTAVSSGGGFVPLLAWGDPDLGMVTGNNNYFALSPTMAGDLGLSDREVTPISPPGSRHLRGLALTLAAWKSLGARGARTLLFTPDPHRPSAAARRYIAQGEAQGVHDAYKCRIRKNWWQVPVVPQADLLVTCMNHDAPRLVANRAGVLHLNSVHGVVLRAKDRTVGMRQLPIGMLNSVTVVGAELHGRSYGGGILKLEPKEADRLPVPMPPALRAAAGDLDAVRPKVEGLLADGRFADAVGVVDQLLLGRLGVTAEDAVALQDAREYLFWRRTQRH